MRCFGSGTTHNDGRNDKRHEFRLAQMVLLVCASTKVLVYMRDGENTTGASGGAVCCAYTKGKAAKVIEFCFRGAHTTTVTQILHYRGYV